MTWAPTSAMKEDCMPILRSLGLILLLALLGAVEHPFLVWTAQDIAAMKARLAADAAAPAAIGGLGVKDHAWLRRGGANTVG
jgi:hypothetical protein